MNEYAWILCSSDKTSGRQHKDWLGVIIRKLYLLFFARPQLYKIYYSEENKAEGYLIRLPWLKKELQALSGSNITGMARRVSRLISDNSITRVYPEPCLVEKAEFRNEMLKRDISCLNCGYDLFVSLTEHMLNHIAIKRRKVVEKLEITIIAGKSTEALKTLILKLAGSVGLVTVTGEQSGDYGGELGAWLENICDETGLSIRLTTSTVKAVSESDIIISFEEEPEYGRYENKPVIWFGQKSIFQIKCCEFYPYRIEIIFPAILYNHYTQELVSCFGSLGIAEVILDSGITPGNRNSFPEIERINLLKRKLYEEMEDIRYIRKPLE